MTTLNKDLPIGSHILWDSKISTPTHPQREPLDQRLSGFYKRWRAFLVNIDENPSHTGVYDPEVLRMSSVLRFLQENQFHPDYDGLMMIDHLNGSKRISFRDILIIPKEIEGLSHIGYFRGRSSIPFVCERKTQPYSFNWSELSFEQFVKTGRSRVKTNVLCNSTALKAQRLSLRNRMAYYKAASKYCFKLDHRSHNLLGFQSIIGNMKAHYDNHKLFVPYAWEHHDQQRCYRSAVDCQRALRGLSESRD